MPQPFPHHYEIKLDRRSAKDVTIKSLSGSRSIPGGPPPQFDGSDQVWSPEELLLSAIDLCLLTTFTALLGKTPLEVQTYESSAQGTLEKTTEGLRFTQIKLQVHLKTSDNDKAVEILKKAKKYCIVSNTLNISPELEIQTI